MNLGIIAHNSKKVLIEDFCMHTRISLPNMKYMKPEQQEEELRRQPVFTFTSFLPEV